MTRILMQIRVRLMNPAAENEIAVKLLAEVFEIIDDSGDYPNRGNSTIVRRYLTLSPRADALPEELAPPAPADPAPAVTRPTRRALPSAPGARAGLTPAPARLAPRPTPRRAGRRLSGSRHDRRPARDRLPAALHHPVQTRPPLHRLDQRPPARLEAHRAGLGARLTAVVAAAGIDWTLARTWTGVTRAKERSLKNSGSASRYCPLCGSCPRLAALPAPIEPDPAAAWTYVNCDGPVTRVEAACAECRQVKGFLDFDLSITDRHVCFTACSSPPAPASAWPREGART